MAENQRKTTPFNLRPVFALLMLFVMGTSFAQNQYGIKRLKDKLAYHRDCSRFITVLDQRAKEVVFGVSKDNDGSLYFQFNNKKWFDTLFKDPQDGMAIQVIAKESFDCRAPFTDPMVEGTLLKPIFTNHLKKNVEEIDKGRYRVKVGKEPVEYFNKEVEYNMFLLGNKSLCRYQTTFNLQSYNFDLLDMGLYMDTIVYKEPSLPDSLLNGVMRYKSLQFQIPFKKNKVAFKPEDIKPLYDSLRLTDFNIKKMDIRAYASVEGTTERNLELQNGRAKSIAQALQTFQEPAMEINISTAENWVEFLNDVSETDFDYLKQKSKIGIKHELNEEGAKEELEPILKHHRKAVITLSLEKIDHYKDLSDQGLVEGFNQAIASDEMEQAQLMQQALFERIRNLGTDPSLLENLEIPKQKKYVDFFNSNSAFRYSINKFELINALYAFQELNKLDPNNLKVAYNYCALLLRYNHEMQGLEKEKELLQRITQLKEMGLSRSLVDRMLVNYHIIKSKQLMDAYDYTNKDRSVRFILETFRTLPLTDSDYLSLAQYLTFYYDHDSAIDLLQEKVNQITVENDLLFYYLNLTMVKDKYTRDPDYRAILLNAVDRDQKKFCKIFDSSEKGGVTFQLLRNPYLKNTYCESCE